MKYAQPRHRHQINPGDCYDAPMRNRSALAAFACLTACSGSPPASPTPPPPARVSACATVRCAGDTRCEETHGRASCVPIMRPRAGFCGGIGGIRCPGGGRCVDDPGDDCDPARGGRDCGGVCEGATAP